MPTNILFVVEPGRQWMGGVYYVRNILRTLSYADWMQQNNIHILCPNEHLNIFEPLITAYRNISIHKRTFVSNFWTHSLNRLTGPNIGRFDVGIIKILHQLSITAIFPVPLFKYAFIPSLQIHWIPDFQHAHLPYFFSEKERLDRDQLFKYMLFKKREVVISSWTSMRHLSEYAPDYKCNISVIPFIADIDDELHKLTPLEEINVLKKYGISMDGSIPKYLYISNQFWKHKDHQVVVKALIKLKNNGRPLPLIVCTGDTSDYRNISYFKNLKEMIKNNELTDKFVILSMLTRIEQLSILKNCHALLQPSLFEGWNTSVQEAKRLGLKLFLSDIDIHREQGDNNSIFFKVGDEDDLANKMIDIFSQYSPSFTQLQLDTLNKESACVYAEGARSIFGKSIV